MKFYNIFIILLLSLFFLQLCSKNLEEEFLEIEKEANKAILNKDLNKIAYLLEELDNLESEESKTKVRILDKSNHSKIYYLTPSRNLFFFGSNKNISFYYNDNIINLDIEFPDKVFSSFNGKFWVFRYNNGEHCMNKFYKIEFDNKKIELKMEFLYEYINSCNSIVLTDSGNIYENNNSQVYLREKNNVKIAIYNHQLKKIFKKNSHKINFYPLPDKGFWIFYGNAGYYDLYYFNEHSLKIIFHGVAEPRVYYVTEELFKDDVNFQQYYFVFTGAAGQYSLTGFLLPEETWKSFNIPPKKDYVYIINQNIFLYSNQNKLYFFNPNTEKEIQLPIKINSFFVYKNALILNTDSGLLVRKEPFSNLEKKIFALKEELIYVIR